MYPPVPSRTIPKLALLQMCGQPLQNLADSWPSDAKAKLFIAVGLVSGIGTPSVKKPPVHHNAFAVKGTLACAGRSQL